MYDTLQSDRLKEDQFIKKPTTKNVSYKKWYNSGMAHEHVEPLPIPLIKEGGNPPEHLGYVNILKQCENGFPLLFHLSRLRCSTEYAATYIFF